MIDLTSLLRSKNDIDRKYNKCLIYEAYEVLDIIWSTWYEVLDVRSGDIDS